MSNYIHGYTNRETQRLYEQSEILKDLLHHDSVYPEYSTILEAGCGVGAQTKILAEKNPRSEIISMDISHEYLALAKNMIESEKIKNVTLQHGDITKLPFANQSFEHIFVCFVLEHVEKSHDTLLELKRVLKTGGSITLIEGDHGSCFWHPRTKASVNTWQSFIRAQQHLGHDPLIGRKIHPLLTKSGFEVKYVEPRWVYTDDTNKKFKEEVNSKIIVPMTTTGKNISIEKGFISEQEWDTGIKDLKKIGNEAEATFFYTWFKGIGIKK